MSFSGMPVLFKHMAISSWDIFSSVYARIPFRALRRDDALLLIKPQRVGLHPETDGCL